MPGRPWWWWWDLSAVGPVVQCSTLRSSCLALFKQSLQCRSSRSCPSLWTNQRRAGLAAVAVAAAASQLVCSLLYKPISARRRAFTRLTLLGKWVQQIETCSWSSVSGLCLGPAFSHPDSLTDNITNQKPQPSSDLGEKYSQLAKTLQTTKNGDVFFF